MRKNGVRADIFTFVRDVFDDVNYSYYQEPANLSVLPVTTYEQWWEGVGYKTRNKLRKGLKSGVEYRLVTLDDDLARGVQGIYNESPIRQGRKFYHYGKTVAAIKEELSSFLERSIMIGAFFEGELIGFMKLFEGNKVLRTIHIIAKLKHRDKNVMDILILKGVELCSERKAAYLQYGSWADGGIGVFREKHGFQCISVPRYFAPLNLRGRLFLRCKLHRSLRELMPQRWVKPAMDLRAKWNAHRFGRIESASHGA